MENFDDEIYLAEDLCKSISGEEDENGNYKFEVEASNENLDLQNQITLQRALEDSEEYFLTNGVVSDDHQHKTRNPDGTVESHKDKIIGEPLSVRYDKKKKKTFVKGILYAGIDAAKPYIDLLKNKSKLVKASIGGIMPKIRKNADGSETVTSFMWNDLALTCSPVNWTVGSAKLAKSIGVVDFCKSLNAGSGTDAATMTDGRALQSEDIENETYKIMDITDGELTGKDENDDVKKNKKEDEELNIIKSCIKAINDGELITKSDIESYLMGCGFADNMAKDTAFEIIKQGGIKMQKSNFSSTIEELLKSFGPEEKEDDKKKKNSENEDDQTLFDDTDMADTPADENDDDVEKGCSVKKGCGVKKSIDEDEEDYLDATELMKSMGEEMDALKEENAELRKSLEEVQQNMIDVTKSFGEFIKQPNSRATVVQKSIDGNADMNVSGPSKRPSTADFDVLKSALVSASKKVRFLWNRYSSTILNSRNQ